MYTRACRVKWANLTTGKTMCKYVTTDTPRQGHASGYHYRQRGSTSALHKLSPHVENLANVGERRGVHWRTTASSASAHAYGYKTLSTLSSEFRTDVEVTRHYQHSSNPGTKRANSWNTDTVKCRKWRPLVARTFLLWLCGIGSDVGRSYFLECLVLRICACRAV